MAANAVHPYLLGLPQTELMRYGFAANLRYRSVMPTAGANVKDREIERLPDFV